MLYGLSATTRVNKEIHSEVLKDELLLDGGKNEKLFGNFVFRTEQEEWLQEVSFVWLNGDVPTEKVEIFSVKAVKCLNASCSYGMAGDIPEVMLPIEKTIGNGEYCRLESNCNNLFVLSLQIFCDCKDGEYLGKIRLKTDVREYELTVKVLVFDVRLPKANHSRGAFNVWFENNVDSNHNEESAHGELYQEYLDCYELLKAYKVPATELPVRSKLHSEYCASSLGKIFCFEPIRGISDGDLENFVQAAIVATLDEEIPSYLLPYSVVKDGEVYAINKDKLKKILSLMVDYSTKETNLFKKGYFYVTVIDEPTKKLFPSVRRITKDIRDVITEVANEKDFLGKENVKIALLELENVVTAWPEESLHGAVDTWCPGFQGWQQADFRSGMKKLSDLGNKTWWYGCICPWYPYPNYHIDEPLLGARTEGFLRWFYNIGGNLYWAVNSDKYRGENNTLQKIDIFNGTERWTKASGDGSLIFSGEYFGVKEYLPSLRLSAICQGNQDYEYCLLLEEKLKEFCSKYGLHINLKEVIRPIFEKAFNGVALADEQKFYELRSEIANSIETLDSGAVFYLEKIDAKEKTATVVGYLQNGTNVSGIAPYETETFDGYSKVNYKIKLLDRDNYFTVTVQDKDKKIVYKRFISSAIKELPIEKFKTEGKIFSQNYSDKRVYKNLPFTNDEKNSPKLVLDGSFDLSKLDRFVFEVKSFSDFEFYLSVVIEDDKRKEFKVDYEVIKKGKNLLSVHFNPTMQFNGAKEIRSTSRFSHYDKEIKELNQIDLTNIRKIILEIQNAKEFCGYFPREYRREGYEFEIIDGYYTDWDQNPHNYGFLKETEE